MKLAVIDLGTNTCNLLIAEIEGSNFQILDQGKVGVKLGKGGINKSQLTNDAFERATNALKTHLKTIQQYGADKVITIATSAVRDAANKRQFADHLLAETGLKLDIISGEKEAGLIFDGVRLAFGKLPDNALIMDIGGGSNEFIQSKNNEVHWKKSFPLGMARIVEQFKISDPIKTEEISAIENYFESGLAKLWTQIENRNAIQLVGCSGAFDTIVDLIDQTPPGTKARASQKIELQDFEQISESVIHSTKKQREQMTGMEPLRVEMIIPALIFIRVFIERLQIKQITQTDYALREGVLYKWINH